MRNTTKPANPTDAMKRPKAIRFAALLFWTTPYTNNTIDMTNKSKMRDEMLTFSAPYRALPLGKTAHLHPCHHNQRLIHSRENLFPVDAAHRSRPRNFFRISVNLIDNANNLPRVIHVVLKEFNNAADGFKRFFLQHPLVHDSVFHKVIDDQFGYVNCSMTVSGFVMPPVQNVSHILSTLWRNSPVSMASMYLLVISNLHYIRFSVQKGKKNMFYAG